MTITRDPVATDERLSGLPRETLETYDRIARLWLGRPGAGGIDVTSMAEIRKLHEEMGGVALLFPHAPATHAAKVFRRELRDTDIPMPALLDAMRDAGLRQDIAAMPTQVLHHLEARAREYVHFQHLCLMRRPPDTVRLLQDHDRAEAVRRLAAMELARRQPGRRGGFEKALRPFLSDEAYAVYEEDPESDLWAGRKPIPRPALDTRARADRGRGGRTAPQLAIAGPGTMGGRHPEARGGDDADMPPPPDWAEDEHGTGGKSGAGKVAGEREDPVGREFAAGSEAVRPARTRTLYANLVSAEREGDTVRAKLRAKGQLHDVMAEGLAGRMLLVSRPGARLRLTLSAGREPEGVALRAYEVCEAEPYNGARE